MPKSGITSRSPVSVKMVSFGVRDSKGRVMGAQLVTYEAVFKPLGADLKMWYNIAPGRYYALRVWATRDDKTYGATQSTKYFATVSERELAIKKYLAAAKKRATAKGK